MSALDRLVFRPISTARPYLMAKCVLLMLGLDCIVELVSHGGRYGVGGFNVAHFAVLDAVLPVPTPALYVGTLFACSLLAFVLVLGQLRRSLLVVLTTLYTLAWASSLLDAYQHHYLLSLLLVSMCAFPETKLRDLVHAPPVEAHASPHLPRHKPKGRRHSETRANEPVTDRVHALETQEAPGYVSFLLTCAIVYSFTAIMKLEPDWRSGAALSRIVETTTLYPLMIAFGRLGLEEGDWYLWLARGAIAIQSVCAFTYVLAIFRDGFARPGRRALVSGLVLAPFAFHLSADAMDLEIGWFSQYMMVIAAIALLPDSVLRLPLWLVGRLRGLTRAEAVPAPSGDERFSRYVFVALGGVLVPVVLWSVDLPGTLGAGVFSTLVVLAVFVFEEQRGRETADDLPVAVALACLLAFACVSHPRLGFRAGDTYYGVEASSVRYDYYRFVAGDFVRRDARAEAIASYAKAAEYAPTDSLRETTRLKIERLRAGE